MKLSLVADAFSSAAFFQCIDSTTYLLPESFHSAILRASPDLLFVESAWRGQDNAWQGKLAPPGPEILDCLRLCKARGIPTVFWNKEDPVHFGTFLPLARHFDHVFTTDIDCIPRYMKALGHDRVSLLPFAAQPRLQNPLQDGVRQAAFSFAGSWYQRYPQRQREFAELVRAVSAIGPVDIFDRNHGSDATETRFPAEYTPLIKGGLPFDEIDRAYKGYRFALNINTVKRSQSMFARRVFELMASNTLVVSNDSLGLRLFFGDLVAASDDGAALVDIVRPLWDDEARYRRHRLMALRAVLREHTYSHRLSYIQARIAGRSWKPDQPEILILAVADSPEAEQRIISSVARQQYLRCRTLLLRRYVQRETVPVLQPGITCFTDPLDYRAEVEQALHEVPWLALFVAEDFYGPHYLTDLVQARHYSDAAAFGKVAMHAVQGGRCVLQADGQQYRPAHRLAARSALLRSDSLLEGWLDACLDNPALMAVDWPDMLATDEFHYCCNGSELDPASVLEVVGDLPGLDQGLSLADDILPVAERLTAADYRPAVPGPGAMTVTPEQLLGWFGPAPHEKIGMRLDEGNLLISSRLAPDERAVVYARPRFSRPELNLVADNRFQLLLDHDLASLETVLDFQDVDKRKIGHTINPAGAGLSVLLPDACHFLRFALRLQGAGTVRVRALVLGEVREQPAVLLRKAQSLSRSDPASLQVLARQARDAYSAGDYERAAALFEQAMAARPELAHVYRFSLELARRKAVLARKP
ncbi:glycosyltransferase [Malikia sp.]|uniref:glycosyltransferase family protein n=1 Tax=Malikia sp. TaxID=2070706 RepID=UPI00262EC7FA|nr:glycosyltransferase [Malikia sp.]MDD2728275.1 glycosyltransferase [Malikia sp.]